MDVRIDGKVALVTGASRGIGEAIAASLLDSGAAGVTITSRREENITAAADRLSDDRVLALAKHTAGTCRWDDVGIDIIDDDGRLFVLEGNMKYGREGFRQAGIDYYQLMEAMIADGSI